MTGTVFLILCLLSFMLFPCQGQIKSPTNGTTSTFLPGTTDKIDWSYVGAISQIKLRTWFFKSRDGSRRGDLIVIFEDGELESKNLSLIPRFKIEKPATLILMNVDETYNGIYTLVLLRRGSSNTDTSEVTIYIAAIPTVTVSSSTITVDEGENVTCSCTSDGGNPPANVVWTKNGKKFGETEQRENILFLRNVSTSDAGNYVCTAESYPDNKYRDAKSVQLILNYKPDKTIIDFSSDPAVLGKQVVITCVSNGRPRPRHLITHNGTTITDDPVENEFEIFSVFWNTTGIYQCIARNKFGQNSISSCLKVVAEGISTLQTPTLSTNKSPNGTDKEFLDNTSCRTEWYIILISVVSGFFVGVLVSCIASRRRWCRNRKPKRNPDQKPTEADSTYQELDLSKMNKEDNYQSLRGNVARINDVTNHDDSNYTELGKSRDVEDNYQSLT